MNSSETDGRLQVLAGTALLRHSNLVSWHEAQSEFVAVPRETFEHVHRTMVDPVFGRLICWISFSTGAEMLAKGLCLLHPIGEFRTERKVPAYPLGDVDSWVEQYWRGGGIQGMVSVTHFGTLGDLSYTGKRKNGAQNVPLLDKLCKSAGASSAQRDKLIAAYQLLGRSIRNRDAHAYVPNVRDAHYHLVPELFAECFNMLISWLPNGAATLVEWMQEAPKYIESLPSPSHG
jgi:hypothetical protein